MINVQNSNTPQYIPGESTPKKDIDLYSTRHGNTTSALKQYKRKVISTEKNDMNKTSMALLLGGLHNNLLNKYSVVFVHKVYPNATNLTRR